jgi:hypothetical protein
MQKLIGEFARFGIILALFFGCSAKIESTPPGGARNTDGEKPSLTAEANVRSMGAGFLDEYSKLLIPSIPGQPFKVSDLNGDSLLDSVFLVKIVSNPDSFENLKMVNLFGKSLPRSDSSMALGIAFHQPGPSQKGPPLPNFLIHGADFFSTPIWTTVNPWDLIRMVSANDPGEDSTLAGIPDRNGNLIGLYSEASVEFFVYFDGSTFQTHSTGEVP